MALFLGDIPFEDVRDKKSDDLKKEGKLTFGATPVLEADGQILSQTQAMAVYAAKLAGFHPTDIWEAAKVDECLNGCTDVTTTVGSTFRLSGEEKISKREQLIVDGGRLHMHLKGLETICEKNGSCGCAVGKGLTVADLAIWRLVGWFSGGNLDGIPTDYVAKTFPSIQKVVSTVDSNKKVQEWKAKHPKFYGES